MHGARGGSERGSVGKGGQNTSGSPRQGVRRWRASLSVGIVAQVHGDLRVCAAIHDSQSSSCRLQSNGAVAMSSDEHQPNQKKCAMAFSHWFSVALTMIVSRSESSAADPKRRRRFHKERRTPVPGQFHHRYGRGRAGQMLYNWAVENLEAVACIAGIYLVRDLELPRPRQGVHG